MDFSLATIWLAVIGFFLLCYAVTDGFGLGVGILCLFSKDQKDRRQMVESLTYIWQTNQTWLVIVAAFCSVPFPCFTVSFSPPSIFRPFSCWWV